MENNEKDNGRNKEEVGSNLTGTAVTNKKDAPQGHESAEERQDDQEFLRKEEDLPDTTKPVQNTDALLGDVDPTDRVDTSQEEKNAEAQNRSDASKISGEQL